VGILVKLSIASPVPFVLNAPALPDQPQQGFGGGTQAGDEPVTVIFTLAFADLGAGDQFHDPGAVWSVGVDVLRGFLGLELPPNLLSVSLLKIHCSARDPALYLELVADLPVKGSSGWT
jgi:hypothetical protein